MSDSPKIFPITIVPAVPNKNGIRFLLPEEKIDVSNEYTDLLWAIISKANGHNDIETISFQSGIETKVVNQVVSDLINLGVMCDSRQQYAHFHKISEAPDTFPALLSIDEISRLQSMPRKHKTGSVYAFKMDCTSSISKTIFSRRSCRKFIKKGLSCEMVGNICYHGYSISSHSVPSGGALYPLKLFVIVTIEGHGLPIGYYEFDSEENILRLYKKDVDIEYLKYCFNDVNIPFDSPVQIVIAANLDRESQKYSNRGYRLTLLEAGHVAQNINLYCTDKGIGCCELGGVLDRALIKELELFDESPILTLSIGEIDTSLSNESNSLFECASSIMEKFVGNGKPIKFVRRSKLSSDASFFAVEAIFGDSFGIAGATSSCLAHATIKAVTEGYERYISEIAINDYIGSADSIDTMWLNPKNLCPSFSRLNGVDGISEYTDSLVIAWKKGIVLSSGKEILVPSDLVYYGDDRSTEYSRIWYGNSSGIAAHEEKEIAIYNSIMEIIERDAIMRNWYERKSPLKIDVTVLPMHVKRRILELKAKGRELYVLDMASTYAPTIMVAIVGSEYPFFVCGAAANLNVETAILKALQEAEYSLFSLESKKLEDIEPESVKSPIDHCALYATNKYIFNIEWLWSGNEISSRLPMCRYEYNELISAIDPIIVDMSVDEGVFVVKAISDRCFPINFGYRIDALEHPVAKNLHINSESLMYPHYFA